MTSSHCSTNYLTSDGCSASMLHKAKGGREREITLTFIFSLCKKHCGCLCLKAFLPSLFSVFCALLVALTNWIQYLLICILPNSQKADHSVKAVLAESVPPNAGIQRAVDTSWEILASDTRPLADSLTNFMFHSTSFHLYGSRLDTQTGT